MTNVTLPNKDGRGKQQGWLQVEKKSHQAMWMFGLKNPSALCVLHFLTSRLQRGSNGVVMSTDAMAQVMGIAPRTAQTAVKALAEGKFLQILKTGKSNAYIINSRVAWQGNRGMRFAVFNSDLVIIEAEQARPVDELIAEADELHTVPILEDDERMLVGNEEIDPPDQGEMTLT